MININQRTHDPLRLTSIWSDTISGVNSIADHTIAWRGRDDPVTCKSIGDGWDEHSEFLSRLFSIKLRTSEADVISRGYSGDRSFFDVLRQWEPRERFRDLGFGDFEKLSSGDAVLELRKVEIDGSEHRTVEDRQSRVRHFAQREREREREITCDFERLGDGERPFLKTFFFNLVNGNADSLSLTLQIRADITEILRYYHYGPAIMGCYHTTQLIC